jgi:hypothetical protein
VKRAYPELLSFIILVLLFTGVNKVSGQKYLLIEKRGNPKTERIAVYEYFTFKLKGDDEWHKRQILGLDANAQLIELGEDWIPLSDLARIKLRRQRTWVNIIGTALQAGGASMVLGDMYSTLVRNEPQYTEGGWEWGLVNIAVGTGMKAALAPIKYHVGGKHRLRIVDLTF